MADVTKIKKQVIDLLSIGDGTHSATIVDADWNSDEIDRYITSAQYVVASKLSGAKNPKLRVAFMQADSAVTNGQTLPVHWGEISKIDITPYSGANFTLRGERIEASRVASYRANPGKVYGVVDHNGKDNIFGKSVPSDRAGFYAIDEDVFTFTGFSATINYADFSSVALSAYPVPCEIPIAYLAVGLAAKDGTVSENFSYCYQKGMEMLMDVIAEEDEENINAKD